MNGEVSDLGPRPRRRRRGVGRVLLGVVGAILVAVVALNWTWGRLPAKPALRGDARFVQVGSLSVHYTDSGGGGEPVLLLHGLPGTAGDFDPVVPLLAGHRVITVDRPGYGYSSGGYVPFATQLTTIHAFLQLLGITRVILVGHSYGGTIALGYAERYPTEVAGLVLVDAAAAGVHPGFTDTAEAHLVNTIDLPVISTITNATFSQLLRTAAAKLGDRQAFEPGRVDRAHLHRLLAINMTNSNLKAFAGETLAAKAVIAEVDRRLASLHTPAVVIQGESDQLVPAHYGRKLAATLPGARLVLVPGGHMQTYEHPQMIAQAVASLSTP